MMNEFTLHPGVYKTGSATGLLRMLEEVWVRRHKPGDGTFYIISGFGNYNGGVRFFPTFKHHTENGGHVRAFFAGSTSQRLTSRQLVQEMLKSGADVTIILRKRLLHAKCYGADAKSGQDLIVTSGNFTGPGMSQNVEAAILLGPETTASMGFSWPDVIKSLDEQDWLTYRPSLDDLESPAWKLLYDEYETPPALDESEEVTMLVTLGHADTVRIQAKPGTEAAKGTQYFWLSRDGFDFFPPLTIRNARGEKATYSCLINLTYVDLGQTAESRVTFEAENNLDFRLGTGPLRATKLAAEGDLAAITRRSETDYELRIIRTGSTAHAQLAKYAVNYIGHKGKRYGYISTSDFESIIGS